LRGFRRVSIKAGQAAHVAFDLPASQLAFYDVNIHAFRVNPGKFDIEVGGSSEDIRLNDSIEVTGR
jgi:beta-glucosidase